MFNASNTTPQSIINQVQLGLSDIRNAMQSARVLHDWSSGIALADLTAAPPDGPGMVQADAQAVLNACADAFGFSQLYDTGTDPRNPGAGYVYGASQKIVLGPRKF